MTRISMLRGGTWYTLAVQPVYNKPTGWEVALERVKDKHTAFVYDEELPVILQEMEKLGIQVKSRTH